MPVQAGDFRIELVPGKFRVTTHQGLKVTFRGRSEKFEDSFGDGFLVRHKDSSLPVKS
jgi:hypothetical protein